MSASDSRITTAIKTIRTTNKHIIGSAWNNTQLGSYATTTATSATTTDSALSTNHHSFNEINSSRHCELLHCSSEPERNILKRRRDRG